MEKWSCVFYGIYTRKLLRRLASIPNSGLLLAVYLQFLANRLMYVSGTGPSTSLLWAVVEVDWENQPDNRYLYGFTQRPPKECLLVLLIDVAHPEQVTDTFT